MAAADDGTTYVVDHVGGIDSRSFVSAPGARSLHRQKNCGSTSGNRQYIWELYETADQMLVLRIDRAAWHRRFLGPQHFAMAVTRRQKALADIAETMTAGDVLEIVPPSTVNGWSLHNRQENRIEYLAQTDDGRWLLVTHPNTTGLSLEKVRVFFGGERAVQERRLIAFLRDRAGGNTTVQFEFDGVKASAYFPVPNHLGRSPYPRSGDDPATLQLGAPPMLLHRHLRNEALPRGLTFICRVEAHVGDAPRGE